MKRFTFNFDLDAWVRGVEIEANSYEEALDELTSMDFDDIISEGYVKSFDINNVDYDLEDDEEEFEEE